MQPHAHFVWIQEEDVRDVAIPLLFRFDETKFAQRFNVFAPSAALDATAYPLVSRKIALVAMAVGTALEMARRDSDRGLVARSSMPVSTARSVIDAKSSEPGGRRSGSGLNGNDGSIGVSGARLQHYYAALHFAVICYRASPSATS